MWCIRVIWSGDHAAGFFLSLKSQTVEPLKIATEIETLHQLERIYRLEAKEAISKLKSVIIRRKQLQQLINPKENWKKKEAKGMAQSAKHPSTRPLLFALCPLHFFVLSFSMPRFYFSINCNCKGAISPLHFALSFLLYGRKNISPCPAPVARPRK